MSSKKLFTRPEFEQWRLKSAAGMAADKRLRTDARRVLIRADKHQWIHQTTWFGEPILNTAEDMFALQEIIFNTRPDYIIEVGVAWGGSLLFYASLMEVLGGQRIIGIDIYMPPDLKRRLRRHRALSSRLELITGSSTAPATMARVKKSLGRSRRVMVVLDSQHSHQQVLDELNLYSPLVGKGQYLVCGDTIVEYIPKQVHRLRPWGPGDSPKTALDQFLKTNDRFTVDTKLENKLLFTCNPGGYLKCQKN